MDNKIIVMGDIHGEYGALNTFISKNSPQTILQCGDFGYFPRWTWELHNPNKKRNKYSKLPEVKSKDTKIYWADGNHEDHETLLSLKNNEIFPNTFYMKRGSVLTLPDGRNVLFMGGADSHDKESRCRGIDWFPQEVLTQKDVMQIDVNTKIDIVISHTAPYEFEIEKFIVGGNVRANDFSRKALTYILKTFNPSLWYFGHWHQYLTGYNNGCRWTCLNHIRSSSIFFEELRSK